MCMEEQGWQYFPTPSVYHGISVVSDDFVSAGSNEDYAASLGNSERTAYYLALTGVEDPYDEVNGYSPDKGCMNESLQKVPGVYLLASVFQQDLADLENQAMAEALGSDDYQSAYRKALITAQNEFASEHKTILDDFQKTHEETSSLVDALIHHWDERA